MVIESTPLSGLFVVRDVPSRDERGTFARVWCASAWAAQGIEFHPVQLSLSTNKAALTLRGLHWQAEPHAETKLVRVTAGAVWDVAVDLRPNSTTYKTAFGIELSAENNVGLLIPKGFAHGFMTLVEGSVLLYVIDQAYVADAACGARYDDPAFAIEWPREPAVISARDLAFAPFGN